MPNAFYIGGFRPFHNGHVNMILRGLETFDKIHVMVGSYSNAPNARCPFTGEQRKGIIEKWVKNNNLTDRVFVGTHEDYYDDNEWAETFRKYERENYKKTGDRITNVLMCTGRESMNYHNVVEKIGIQFWYMPPLVNISATEIRDWFFDVDNYKHMEKMMQALPTESLEFLFKNPVNPDLKKELQAIKEIKEEAAKCKYPPIYSTADALIMVNVKYTDYVLMIQRKSDIGNKLLAIPGGYIEQHETAKQAALRELYEETGLLINQNDVVRSKFMIADIPGRSLRGRIISNVFYYYVGYRDEGFPDIRVTNETYGHRWVPVECFKNPSDPIRAFCFEDHWLIVNNMLFH